MLRFVLDALLGKGAADDKTPSESGHLTDEAVMVYIVAVLTDARNEIGRADQKAAALLAASGVGVGALIAGLLGGQWSPTRLPGSVQWLWWVGIVLCALGVLSLGFAIYPRSSRGAARIVRRRGVFLGDFASAVKAELGRAKLGRDARVRIELVVSQVEHLASIVDVKYRHIRRGMLLLLAAILCCASAVVLAPLLV
ncbi:Pycsar system effector family protein [Streptosporangium carneum]|uniref:Pycsar system effector family protein n=1 Tax=Streptosporangium carneum TaxID=47481 RepID=UPI0022F334FB|nr:Pycsar system effector family protein [Streptosporangium carneum]